MDPKDIQKQFGIIGTSQAIRQVVSRAGQVANTNITVMVQGESGTGKELVAEVIHGLSERRHGPLKILNAGAIPEGLIESELFGSEKGAFTGATEKRKGYFEEADGGTLFLDEIGEMPKQAQVRLLRVLETGTFSRIGSTTMRKTDTRLLAATNKNLAREVGAGRFREDLYYRLSTVIIEVPPLRERGDDIILLLKYFMHQFSRKYRSRYRDLDDTARQLLRQYRWPGNVRELRNVAEQIVVMHEGNTVSATDIKPLLRGVTAGVENSTALVPVHRDNSRESGSFQEREVIYRAFMEIRHGIEDLKKQIAHLTSGMGGQVYAPRSSHNAIQEVPLLNESLNENFEDVQDITFVAEPRDVDHMPITQEKDSSDPIPTIERAESELIKRALTHYNKNRRLAAQALGISERTLYRKIKALEANGEYTF